MVAFWIYAVTCGIFSVLKNVSSITSLCHSTPRNSSPPKQDLLVLNTAVDEKRLRCVLFGLEQHGLLRNF